MMARVRRPPADQVLATALIALAFVHADKHVSDPASGALPFTFVVGETRYGGGDESGSVLQPVCTAPNNCTTLTSAGWNATTVVSPLDANKTLVTTVYTDAPGRSGLQVRGATQQPSRACVS